MSLGKSARATQPKARAKAKARARAALPPEYNLLLTATLCLIALGAVMVFSASSTAQVLSDGGLSNSIYFLQRTLIFAAVGLVIMHLLARRGLDLVRRLTPAILVFSLLSLVAVLIV
ncbi:MAG TPA: FtsW/RodA/SpoVE family cell cycle protein, partial [Solirubrobacterales bacterium]|nr:FtsW/RodA/SpoVE family cell cycle protein [Solirubrobacterales bacterium]